MRADHVIALLSSVALSTCGEDDGARSERGIVSPGSGPAADEAPWVPFPGFRRGPATSPDTAMDPVMFEGRFVLPFLGERATSEIDRDPSAGLSRPPLYPEVAFLHREDIGLWLGAINRLGAWGPRLLVPDLLRDGLTLDHGLAFQRDTRAITAYGIRRLWRFSGSESEAIVEGRGLAPRPTGVHPLEMPSTLASPAPPSTAVAKLSGQPIQERFWYTTDGIVDPGVRPSSEAGRRVSPTFESWPVPGGFGIAVHGICADASTEGIDGVIVQTAYIPKPCTRCYRYDTASDAIAGELESCPEASRILLGLGPPSPMPNVRVGLTFGESGRRRILKSDGATLVTGPESGPYQPVWPAIEGAPLAVIASPTDTDPDSAIVVSDRGALVQWTRLGSDGHTAESRAGIGGAQWRSHTVSDEGNVQWRVSPEGTINRVVARAEGLFLERTARVDLPEGHVLAGVVHSEPGASAIWVVSWARYRNYDTQLLETFGYGPEVPPDYGDLYLHRVALSADPPIERQNPVFALEARDLGPDARVCWADGFEAPSTQGWTLGDSQSPATIMPFDGGRCVLAIRGEGGVVDLASHEVIGEIPGAGATAVGVGDEHLKGIESSVGGDRLDNAQVDWAELATLAGGGFRGRDHRFETGLADLRITEIGQARASPEAGGLAVPDRAGHGLWVSFLEDGTRVLELRGDSTRRFEEVSDTPRADLFVDGGGVVLGADSGLSVMTPDGGREPLAIWAEAGELYRPRVVFRGGGHCGLVRKDVVDPEATCPFAGLDAEDLRACIGEALACVDADGVAKTASADGIAAEILWPEDGPIRHDGVALPGWYVFRHKASSTGAESRTVVVDQAWRLDPETMAIAPLLSEDMLVGLGLDLPRGVEVFVSMAMDVQGRLFAHVRIEALGASDHHLLSFETGEPLRATNPAVRRLGLGAVSLVAVEPALFLLTRGGRAPDLVRIPR